MNKITEIEAIGEYLHGGNWKAATARDLNVNSKTLWRWITGESTASPSVMDDLITLAACKFVQLEAVKAATSGRWSNGSEIVFSQEKSPDWSEETDKLIKIRAAQIMREMGISARVVEK